MGDKKALPNERTIVDIGNRENFRCTLQNENIVKWYDSTGRELSSTPEGRIKTFRNGTFIIEGVQLSDGGTYQCKGLEYIRYYTIYVDGR